MIISERLKKKQLVKMKFYFCKDGLVASIFCAVLPLSTCHKHQGRRSRIHEKRSNHICYATIRACWRHKSRNKHWQPSSPNCSARGCSSDTLRARQFQVPGLGASVLVSPSSCSGIPCPASSIPRCCHTTRICCSTARSGKERPQLANHIAHHLHQLLARPESQMLWNGQG